MPYGFVEDPERKEDFLVHFDGVRCGTIHGSRTDVEAYVERLNREADRVQRALESSDRRALCRLGWHRRRYEDGTPLFFQCLPRLWGVPFGFRIGRAPFDYACTKIADFGGPEPWFCEACEEEISA